MDMEFECGLSDPKCHGPCLGRYNLDKDFEFCGNLMITGFTLNDEDLANTKLTQDAADSITGVITNGD